MADQRIQYSEEMVGAGHGTKADTLNRLALVEHNSDGTHSAVNADTVKVESVAPTTPAANTIYKDAMVCAVLNFSNTGTPTIDDDVNVSGLVDNGVGDITVTFATAMANANYTLQGSTVSIGILTEQTLATGSARFKTYDTVGAVVDKSGSLTIIGEM